MYGIIDVLWISLESRLLMQLSSTVSYSIECQLYVLHSSDTYRKSSFNKSKIERIKVSRMQMELYTCSYLELFIRFYSITNVIKIIVGINCVTTTSFYVYVSLWWLANVQSSFLLLLK